MYPHEKNIQNKISNNYGEAGAYLESFREKFYIPFRAKIDKIDFCSDKESFKSAAKIFSEYWKELRIFAAKHNISSQSKFESSFLEEISVYLFSSLPKIKDGSLQIFNKGIYAGLKFKEDLSIDVIKKDVDFCIGKEIQISIENQPTIQIRIPAISVEVKTYLDATMFGEVRNSSRTLKSATPSSKTYVLMGYISIAPEHIIAARQDSVLDEMFVLQKDKNSHFDSQTLEEYFFEISNAVNSFTSPESLYVPGRLLKPVKVINR